MLLYMPDLLFPNMHNISILDDTSVFVLYLNGDLVDSCDIKIFKLKNREEVYSINHIAFKQVDKFIFINIPNYIFGDGIEYCWYVKYRNEFNEVISREAHFNTFRN